MSGEAFRRALAAEIAAAGRPMPFAQVMARAVEHYYRHHEPFGAGGDFVTAPEISQMAGEFVALWWADLWIRAGRPRPWAWVELGPGRGTLAADAARALSQAAPDCLAAARLHLVERSERLRAAQRSRLAPLAPEFHSGLETLPTGLPTFVVANEFFDALPVALWDRRCGAWRERVVTAGLAFAEGRAAEPGEVPAVLDHAVEGAVCETSPARAELARVLASRLSGSGGAALIIDYGYRGPALGETVQALLQRRFADPLATLGDADLSAHVDFSALAESARPLANAIGPVDQGAFLMALGLRQRADRLKAGRPPEARAVIEAEVARLAGAGAMGRLFQVLVLVAPGWPHPAGLA